jgi:hypothetical protein
MHDDFRNELANPINQLTHTAQDLEAWALVISGLDLDAKIDVLMEFIFDRAAFGLCAPYAFRARFIFATAHLCHQANRAKLGPAWKDDLEDDSKIDFGVADARGALWKKYGKLKQCLEGISNKDFDEQTFGFRNKFNHRFSPGIEVGLTQFVQRLVRPDGSVYYKLSENLPLPLTKVADIIKQQLTQFSKALAAFDALVQEHVQALSA